jgi:hypothetical protein
VVCLTIMNSLFFTQIKPSGGIAPPEYTSYSHHQTAVQDTSASYSHHQTAVQDTSASYSHHQTAVQDTSAYTAPKKGGFWRAFGKGLAMGVGAMLGAAAAADEARRQLRQAEVAERDRQKRRRHHSRRR